MAKIDDSVKKKVPELRFKGFTDPWVQRNLSDLATFSKGKGYSKSDLVSDGFPAILYGRMYTNYESQIDDISDTFVADATDAVLSQTGDVIVPGSGETPEDIARASNVNVSGIVLGGDINIIRPDTEKMDSTFLALTISNGQQQTELIKRAQGKSVVHLHNSDLKKVNVVAPSKDEQSAISSLFTQLDNLIAANQRKLDLLKEQKKGYLQKMLPKNGAKVPELRFAGFADDWEQRKVGELYKVTRGQVLATSKTTPEKVGKNQYPVYSSQTKNDGLMGYYSDYLFDTAITWTTDGANAGTVNFRPGKFYSTNVNGVLLSADGLANKAMAENLNRSAWKWVSHVGNPKLMNNVMSQISVMIPVNLSEQEKISEFLMMIDNTIALHQRKLDLLKEQKKGFLQKMFV